MSLNSLGQFSEYVSKDGQIIVFLLLFFVSFRVFFLDGVLAL